jgi:hypothetical protein
MLTLEPPNVNTGQFPVKVPRPAVQSSSKMAEIRFLIAPESEVLSIIRYKGTSKIAGQL